MLHSQFAALGLAATALAASGCGNSSKTTSSASIPQTTAAQSTTNAQTAPTSHTKEIKIKTGPQLTRAALIAKGDAICTRIDAQLEAAKNSTEQDLARDLPLAATADQQEAAELSKLVPPTAIAKDWSEILNDIQAFSVYTAKAAGYAETGKFPEATSLVVAGNAVQKKFTILARRDGFKVCSIA